MSLMVPSVGVARQEVRTNPETKGHSNPEQIPIMSDNRSHQTAYAGRKQYVVPLQRIVIVLLCVVIACIAFYVVLHRRHRCVHNQGLALAGLGLALGLAAAVAGTRLLTSMLFQVQPNDLVVYLAVAVLLGMVALVASYVPARRASRIDPLTAIRQG